MYTGKGLEPHDRFTGNAAWEYYRQFRDRIGTLAAETRSSKCLEEHDKETLKAELKALETLLKNYSISGRNLAESWQFVNELHIVLHILARHITKIRQKKPSFATSFVQLHSDCIQLLPPKPRILHVGLMQAKHVAAITCEQMPITKNDVSCVYPGEYQFHTIISFILFWSFVVVLFPFKLLTTLWRMVTPDLLTRENDSDHHLHYCSNEPVANSFYIVGHLLLDFAIPLLGHGLIAGSLLSWIYFASDGKIIIAPIYVLSILAGIMMASLNLR